MYIVVCHKDDGESSTVIKDKGRLQEEYGQSHETPLKQKLVEIGEPSNKMDDHQNQDGQNPSKSNNQQEKDKKQRSSENVHQSSNQISDPSCCSCAKTDNHLDQDSRKDDSTDQQQSNTSNEQLQDDNEDGDTNVKKKLEHDSSHEKEVHNLNVTVDIILYHQCLLILLVNKFCYHKGTT